MSHLGNMVWVSEDPLCDPMREFGVEADDDPTRPLPRASMFQRVTAESRTALPQAPPPEPKLPERSLPETATPMAARPVPVAVPEPAAVLEPVVVPVPAAAIEAPVAPADPVAPAAPVVATAGPAAPETAALAIAAPATAALATAAPSDAAPASTAPAAAAQRGRWFVGVAALALLTLGQAPFVVLWALQSVNGPEPIAIQVAKPPVPFAPAPSVPIERTVVPPPRPAAPTPKPVPAGSLSGWLHVEVPVPMRILEDGRLLGTTDVDRLMLPTGDHVLDLRNDELGFSTRQVVTIKAGETAILAVRLPSASFSINAKPWAEAWVDGERVGDTPIGTLMRTIGRHEVVLRHPELGERRVPVLVTLGQPARVIVDFKAGK